MEALGDISHMGPIELIYHVADTVLGAVEKQVESPANLVADFIESVTWSEPFIIAMLVFQAAVLTLAIVTRKRITAQLVLFTLIALAVFMAEPLNRYGRGHWSEFATQNYFDKNGLFAAIFYAGPLLISCNVILFNFCVQTARMAIKVRRMKMRAEMSQSNTNGHTKTD